MKIIVNNQTSPEITTNCEWHWYYQQFKSKGEVGVIIQGFIFGINHEDAIDKSQ